MKPGESEQVLGGVLGVEGSCVLLPGWTRWGADRETEAQVRLGSSGPSRSLRDCGGASGNGWGFQGLVLVSMGWDSQGSPGLGLGSDPWGPPYSASVGMLP